MLLNLTVNELRSPTMALSGVEVRLYNQTGTALLAEGRTNSLGMLSFDVPVGTYSLRLNRALTVFRNPKYVTVDPVRPNNFSLHGTQVLPPSSTDPRLCMAYIYLRNSDGSAARRAKLTLFPAFDTFKLGGATVVPRAESVMTNEDGFAAIPLIRYGIYHGRVEAEWDWDFPNIAVPDSPNFDLSAQFFPVLRALELNPPAPYTLLVGEELLARPRAFYSNGNSFNVNELEWTSDDPSVLTVRFDGEFVRFQAHALGAAYVHAQPTRVDVVQIPLPVVEGVPIPISVIPP